MHADRFPTPYSAAVVEHFDRPRNIGTLAAAADVIVGRAGGREHGVEFVVSARITAGHIDSLRFAVYGCPHCIAAASWLSERLAGGTRSDLQSWSWREAATALEIPAEKRGRLLILEDALRDLARQWQQGS